jgi:hypothetical protein
MRNIEKSAALDATGGCGNEGCIFTERPPCCWIDVVVPALMPMYVSFCFVCDAMGVRCIDFLQMIRELNLTF